ncbi:MAG: type I-C CRISPR-associated protein Cas8c/Csd1 [Bacteroidota bacterium]
MILQALHEYYQRNADLPREGFEIIRLKFIIVIKEDGTFMDLVDQRDGRQGKEYLLPKSKGRTSPGAWRTTFLLWDHYGYVLSHPKDSEKKSIEMAKKQNNIFINSIRNLPDELKKDAGVNSMLSFYEKNQSEKVKKHPRWQDCSKINGCNLTFKLDGHTELIPQRKAIVDYQTNIWDKQEIEGKKPFVAPCLITGLKSPVALIHTATPILESKSKSTAKLVGIQKNSGYDSYKKQQAYNAPVSIKAEYAYTTALKHLIHSTTNHVVVSDTTILFWAKKLTTSFDLEQSFAYMISPKDDPDKRVRVVEALFKAIETGQLPYDGNSKFFVLGLAAPTPARISIRIWKVGTVREFGERIYQHFKDLEVIKAAYEQDYCTLNELLANVSVETKDRKKPNVVYFRGRYFDAPPNLASSIIDSILDGTQYSSTLLQQCIRRIRAEVSKRDKNGKLIENVTRPRAAILKAYLNRINKNNNQNIKEVAMALDKENTEVGYVLGRLFALLESVQEESAKPIRLNSTIRERYYGSFSSSPVVVMPLLLKLKNHHIVKLNGGLKNWFEAEIKQVVDLINPKDIPSHLTLEQQALFAVGYYHQKNSKK